MSEILCLDVAPRPGGGVMLIGRYRNTYAALVLAAEYAENDEIRAEAVTLIRRQLGLAS